METERNRVSFILYGVKTPFSQPSLQISAIIQRLTKRLLHTLPELTSCIIYQTIFDPTWFLQSLKLSANKQCQNSLEGTLHVSSSQSLNTPPTPHLELCVTLTWTVTLAITVSRGITHAATLYVPSSHFSINHRLQTLSPGRPKQINSKTNSQINCNQPDCNRECRFSNLIPYAHKQNTGKNTFNTTVQGE